MKLWKHQADGLERASKLDHFGFFFDPGLGKTLTTIKTLIQKFDAEGGMFKTLIFCPQIAITNWRDEWLKFSSLKDSDILMLQGDIRERIHELVISRAQIAITNYEALARGDDFFEALKNWGPRAIVCDESQRIKSHNAQRTKKVIALGDVAQYKYILSGTPILKNQMDIWSQFRFLDGGATFGSNYWTFQNTYFYNANRNKPSHVTWPDWRFVQSREDEFKEKISRLTMSAKKYECLDLPPFIRVKVPVEMSSAQAKAYKEMKNNFITFINSAACTADLAVTKALRLQQIVSGFIKDEDGTERVFEKTPRESALRELLEDLTPEHKVIVWAAWRNNYDVIKNICDDLKLKSVLIVGGQSPRSRADALEDFRSDKDTRVLIGSQSAGGIAINLIESDYSIYYSRGFSLEADIQSEARNYRGGSEIHSKVTRIDLMSPGTIDEEVLEALKAKQEIGDKILFEMAKRL
jgi:SNF2 family DNA or RNA helicase